MIFSWGTSSNCLNDFTFLMNSCVHFNCPAERIPQAFSGSQVAFFRAPTIPYKCIKYFSIFLLLLGKKSFNKEKKPREYEYSFIIWQEQGKDK